MRLQSVNVGEKRPIQNAGKSGETGIYKRLAKGPVEITAGGLAGDNICDVKNHGGPDQAVYFYGVPDYEWWSEELGFELSPGTFGENLTITGLESAGLQVGDHLEIGAVVLEVTAPRIPCATLAARMGEPGFVKRFRYAERPGAYCRVLRGGDVRAGEPVEPRRYSGETVSLVDMFREFFEPRPAEESVRRQLAAPIAARARVEKERQLGEILARKQAASVALAEKV